MVYSGVAPNESKLFAQEVDEREESTDLKIVLLITLALLAVELVTLFHKHHFMTLLCLFMIISAFVLNYFEKKYVVLMMASLGISTIFDLAWLIAQAGVPFLRFSNTGIQQASPSTPASREGSSGSSSSWYALACWPRES